MTLPLFLERLDIQARPLGWGTLRAPVLGNGLVCLVILKFSTKSNACSLPATHCMENAHKIQLIKFKEKILHQSPFPSVKQIFGRCMRCCDLGRLPVAAAGFRFRRRGCGSSKRIRRKSTKWTIKCITACSEKLNP